MEKFGERALKLRKQLNMSQEIFAQEIGISSKQTVSNVEKGKQKKYTDEEINKIINKYKVNRAWLILGEGEMFEGQLDTKYAVSISDEDHSKVVKAPIMSVKASAGKKGAEHYEVVTTGELLIDRMLFKVIPNLKNIRAIEVDGDSMYPTLKEGDYVIIEENREFSGDGIYVLQWDGILLVKRLQAGTGEIDIISDNQSYPPKKYVPSDDQRSFHIVGKVILRMQR